MNGGVPAKYLQGCMAGKDRKVTVRKYCKRSFPKTGPRDFSDNRDGPLRPIQSQSVKIADRQLRDHKADIALADVISR